jgi:hypothetical protein
MALSLGTLAVDAAGNVTGTGAARNLFDLRLAAIATVLPGGVIPTGPDGTKLKEGVALFATADAQWMIAEIQANAQAVIDVTSAGLQRTPNPNNALTATLAPVAPAYLAIT